MLYYLVYVPLGMGILYVFCALLRLPNVGQGYNENFLSGIVNPLCINLPNDLSLAREGLDGPPPYIIHTFACTLATFTRRTIVLVLLPPNTTHSFFTLHI